MGGRGRRHGREQRELIVAAVEEARANGARLHAACAMAGISGRTVERWKKGPAVDLRCGPKHAPANALSSAEVGAVLAVLRSPENVAISPKQLVPRLADAGIYLASESTMYRLKRRHGLGAMRRPADRTGVTRSTATHSATGPNQVWSWDITWLPTTVRGRYLYLYLVMDVWSRRIVGWAVHERESADHAAALIQTICVETGVDPTGLVLHSDNGKPMRGSTMLAMLQWLGIVPSFSRPHVSNDNPYSEALFRTLKQTPAYPSLPFAGAGTARRLGHSLRRLVQRRAPAQRHPLRHPRPAAPRRRPAHPRSPRRALRGCTSPPPRQVDPPSSQLGSHPRRHPQPSAAPPSRCRLKRQPS